MVAPMTSPRLQSLPHARAATADEVEEVTLMLEGLWVTATDLMPRTGLWAYRRLDGTHSPTPSTIEDALLPTWDDTPSVSHDSPTPPQPHPYSPYYSSPPHAL